MKVTDDFVFFWRGIFSNWHLCKITDPITGVEFENSEQAFCWYKADFFKDFGTRNEIEKTGADPQVSKKLGRNVIGYNDQAWLIVRFGLMTYVNYLKFSQNSILKTQLLETGNRILVEASPYDTVWGIGLGEDDPRVLNVNEWKGLNLLGFSLTSLRTDFSLTDIENNEQSGDGI